jgi:hypothetical protein
VSPLPRHLASVSPAPCFSFLVVRLLVFAPVRFVLAPPPPLLQLSPAMAPPPPIVVLEPLPWTRSTVTPFALNELVNGGQLAPNADGAPLVWIVPPATDRDPNLSYGYVISFIKLYERSFTTPASRFMRGLCYHYRVVLHNFAPNAISQAATFVGVCEGFLGIPVNWDLWVHLAWSCTLSPRARQGCVGRYVLTA